MRIAIQPNRKHIGRSVHGVNQLPKPSHIGRIPITSGPLYPEGLLSCHQSYSLRKARFAAKSPTPDKKETAIPRNANTKISPLASSLPQAKPRPVNSNPLRVAIQVSRWLISSFSKRIIERTISWSSIFSSIMTIVTCNLNIILVLNNSCHHMNFYQVIYVPRLKGYFFVTLVFLVYRRKSSFEKRLIGREIVINSDRVFIGIRGARNRVSRKA